MHFLDQGATASKPSASSATTGRVAKSRTEFCHLGLGKCLLLDRLDPRWKARYFDAGVWLPELLDRAVRLQPESCR